MSVYSTLLLLHPHLRGILSQLLNAVRFWKSSALRQPALGEQDPAYFACLVGGEDSGLGGPYVPEDQRCNHSSDHSFDHAKIFRFALLMTREYS